MSTGAGQRTRAQACRWCGRQVTGAVPDPSATTGAPVGRRRLYCRQSCRQRAYEQRSLVRGTALAADAVVLTAAEAAGLSDRIYQVRCAAEDIATAVAEGAPAAELQELCTALLVAARGADGWR